MAIFNSYFDITRGYTAFSKLSISLDNSWKIQITSSSGIPVKILALLEAVDLLLFLLESVWLANRDIFLGLYIILYYIILYYAILYYINIILHYIIV